MPSVSRVAVVTHGREDVTAAVSRVEALARERGLDPDKPRHLRKVTRTQ